MRRREWPASALNQHRLSSSFKQLQVDVIAATKPFTGETATIDAFTAPQATPALDKALIDCVSTFDPKVFGAKINPHISIGVAPKDYFDKMVAEPFERFSFRPQALWFINPVSSVRRRESSRSGICNRRIALGSSEMANNAVMSDLWFHMVLFMVVTTQRTNYTLPPYGGVFCKSR